MIEFESTDHRIGASGQLSKLAALFNIGDSSMAANPRITKGAETPSERFERVMQKVIARDRRADEKRTVPATTDRQPPAIIV